FLCICFFFFQAEDGIRDFHVTGVQTCALPISAISPWLTVLNPSNPEANKVDDTMLFSRWQHVFPRTSKMKVMKWKALCCPAAVQIGRASCRERGESWVGAGSSQT